MVEVQVSSFLCITSEGNTLRHDGGKELNVPKEIDVNISFHYQFGLVCDFMIQENNATTKKQALPGYFCTSESDSKLKLMLLKLKSVVLSNQVLPLSSMGCPFIHSYRNDVTEVGLFCKWLKSKQKF